MSFEHVTFKLLFLPYQHNPSLLIYIPCWGGEDETQSVSFSFVVCIELGYFRGAECKSWWNPTRV